ncbi:MAG: helix-turn-helix transcriptional regulator [Victivallales bacterium]
MEQKYNWSVIVKEIQDTEFMSQQQMATKCNVSQQSISNWMNGARNPGPFATIELLKMTKDAGIDIHKHEANPAFDGITDYMKKNKGRELVRLFELYSRMSNADKKRFIRYAEGMKAQS